MKIDNTGLVLIMAFFASLVLLGVWAMMRCNSITCVSGTCGTCTACRAGRTSTPTTSIVIVNDSPMRDEERTTTSLEDRDRQTDVPARGTTTTSPPPFTSQVPIGSAGGIPLNQMVVTSI